MAADIHGKNRHVDGSLSEHLLRLRLAVPRGDLLDLRPEDEGFLATVGGMGLTGVIVETTTRSGRQFQPSLSRMGHRHRGARPFVPVISAPRRIHAASPRSGDRRSCDHPHVQRLQQPPLGAPFVPAIAVRLALMIKRLPRRERRYREPVRATTPLEALRQRLHTLPDQADV